MKNLNRLNMNLKSDISFLVLCSGSDPVHRIPQCQLFYSQTIFIMVLYSFELSHAIDYYRNFANRFSQSAFLPDLERSRKFPTAMSKCNLI